MDIRTISETNISDINVPNQPFKVFGRIVPIFDGIAWTFSEVILDDPYEYEFPNDDIDYSEYIDNCDKTVFFLYIGKECAGQIRIRRNWNEYCFIEDIAVGCKFRKKGFAKSLLESAELWAKEHGLKGFMLESQDFNLGACRFYQKNGFIIGSVDNLLYNNTINKGELAIFWYKLFSSV